MKKLTNGLVALSLLLFIIGCEPAFAATVSVEVVDTTDPIVTVPVNVTQGAAGGDDVVLLDSPIIVVSSDSSTSVSTSDSSVPLEVTVTDDQGFLTPPVITDSVNSVVPSVSTPTVNVGSSSAKKAAPQGVVLGASDVSPEIQVQIILLQAQIQDLLTQLLTLLQQ